MTVPGDGDNLVRLSRDLDQRRQPVLGLAERDGRHGTSVAGLLAGVAVVAASCGGWSRDGAQLDKDAVLLVRYPSREAFSRMVADPEYQQVTHLRTEALTEALLQPTTLW